MNYEEYKKVINKNDSLNEEFKLDEKSISRILNLQLEKRLGKVYRWGGERGVQNLVTKMGPMIGYMFFLRGGSAFRFLVSKDRKRKFLACNIWKSYAISKPPLLTIMMNNEKISRSLDYIVGQIKDPRLEKSRNLFESRGLDMLQESKNLVSVDFIRNHFLETTGSSEVTNKQLEEFSKEYNVRFPNKIIWSKDVKARRGVIDLDKALSLEIQSGNGSIGVVRNPDIINDNADAMKILSHINSPIPTKEELSVDSDTLFSDLTDLVGMVGKGLSNSLIVYGGPGIGKTYTVTEVLQNLGLNEDDEDGYYVVKGKITTYALYRLLFLNRKGRVLIFDDTDSVWSDNNSANILKAALDSYEKRKISWSSNMTTGVSLMTPAERVEHNERIEEVLREDPSDTRIKLPSEFDYNGRIIFISNLKKERFDTAILSRAFDIDMTLTDEQVFRRIENVLEQIGDNEVSLEDKKMILNEIEALHKMGKVRNPNFRTFLSAEQIFRSGIPDWQRLLKYS